MNEEGFKKAYKGFKIGNVIMPPEQFGLAALAASKKSKKLEMIKKATESILEGKVKADDFPYFSELIKNQTHIKEMPEEFFEMFRNISKKLWGTYNIMERSLILPINKKGKYVSFSSRDHASFKMKSREHGNARPDYGTYSIINPFTSLDDFDVPKFDVGATSEQTTKNLTASSFLKATPMGRVFLKELKKKIPEYFMKNDKIRITAEDIEADFEPHTKILDFYGALALTTLDKIVRSEPERLIQNRPVSKNDVVMMPYDFSESPYPFEILLMLANKKNLKDANKIYKGKNVTPLFRELYKRGKTEIRVFPDKKGMYISKENLPLLFGYIEHFYREGRRFKGFGEEFSRTPYETVVMIFDGSVREKGNEKTNQLRNEILVGKKFKRPYNYNLNFSVSDDLKVNHRNYANLLRQINVGKDLQGKLYHPDSWIAINNITGQKAECSIWEPHDKVRKLAEGWYSFMHDNNMPVKPLTEGQIRYLYIKEMKRKIV